MTQQAKIFSLFLNRYLYASPRLILNLFNQVKSIDQFINNYNSIQFQFNLKLPDLLEKARQFNYEQELALLNKHGISLLFYNDDNYPSLLKEISDPPLVLFYKGNISLIHKEKIAIVGPRKTSEYGCKVAEYFSQHLSACFVIISGLADGIDAIAHKQCLTHNKETIAVIGTGLTTAYPNKHFSLQQEIAQKGLLLSEFPLDTPPLKQHFPQRNRLISGLSNGVLICEASLKSGSLITANFALEQNKEVYAVPGPIFNDTSKGVHKLIQDGAKCVHSASDILEDFNKSQLIESPTLFQTSTSNVKEVDLSLSDNETIVFNTLTMQPINIEQIVELSTLSIHQLLPILSMLEIKGLISQHPGKNYSKT